MSWLQSQVYPGTLTWHELIKLSVGDLITPKK